MDDSIEEELKLATEAYRAGDLASSLARIDGLLPVASNRADVQRLKGTLECARGNWSGGLEWLVASLRTEPGNASTLAWAAFASLNLQRFEDAELFAGALTEVDPQNARAPYLLAIAFRGLGRIEEALTAIDRSLALEPNAAESLVAKARLLRDRGTPVAAVEVYRRALAAGRTPWAAPELAQMLLDDSQPEEALAILERAMPDTPEPMRPYEIVAQAQSALGQFEQAEANWVEAEKFAQDRVGLVQRRAKAEIAAGRFDIAESLLADAVDDGPRGAYSFSLLSTARKMRATDAAVADRMEALAAKGELPPAQAAELHYALGKTFDDIGDYERAIGHFDEANRISYDLHVQGARFRFSPEDARAYTDAQINYFTPDRLRELSAIGVDSSLPLFVLGMARSGTTLTSNILTAHSKVGGGGEYSFWPERVNEYIRWESGRIILDQDSVARLARMYLGILGSGARGAPFCVDKNPNNFQHAAMLHGIYPNAKILHFLRHPVDNVLSMWMIRFTLAGAYLSKRENLVLTYREHMRFLDHLRLVISEDRFATYRYEELTSDPESTIRQMLKFVGLEPEPACFAPEKNTRNVLTPSVYQVRQPIHTGSQERWRNYLPWLGVFGELLEEA